MLPMNILFYNCRCNISARYQRFCRLIFLSAVKDCSKTPRQGDIATEKYNFVGPAHPVSRLRMVYYYMPTKETKLQLAYRVARQDVHQWNQNYWFNHNISFEKEKQAFISKKLKEKYQQQESGKLVEYQKLTADEMAEFYKQFLDSNHKQHLQYNKDWYRKNFTDIIFAAKVWLEKKKNMLLKYDR